MAPFKNNDASLLKPYFTGVNSANSQTGKNNSVKVQSCMIILHTQNPTQEFSNQTLTLQIMIYNDYNVMWEKTNFFLQNIDVFAAPSRLSMRQGCCKTPLELGNREDSQDLIPYCN